MPDWSGYLLLGLLILYFVRGIWKDHLELQSVSGELSHDAVFPVFEYWWTTKGIDTLHSFGNRFLFRDRYPGKVKDCSFCKTHSGIHPPDKWYLRRQHHGGNPFKLNLY